MTQRHRAPETEILIVGAGIVGCSAAYHLAELGQNNVTVVDQGPIPKTGGSTVHAPAGLTQTSEDRTMSLIAQETKDVYDRAGGWESNGAIEIATTEERWAYFDHMMDQANAWGVEGAELLSPEEVADHVPIIDEDRILGGYYVSTDGRIDTVSVLTWLKTEAERRGVTFLEETEVIDIETAGDTVETVVTDEGAIDTTKVLVAGNIWAPLIGDMVGVDIPLVPCAHQYAVTESLSELEGWDHDVEHPWVRHGDGEMYFRQHGSGYGIGNYNHEPLVMDPSTIASHEEAIEDEPVYDFVPGRGSRHDPFKQPSTRPFTREHFEDAWQEATSLFPDFQGADLSKGFNGMFSFTPDHKPILGEAPGVDGFWVAAAVWLTHGGGMGRVVADLVETGGTDLDIGEMHITRFQRHAGSPSFIRDRGYETYDTVYDVPSPRGSFRTHRNLRRSSFHSAQERLDAEFYDDDGWERARWYGANEPLRAEYSIPERSGWEADGWSPIEGGEYLAMRDRGGIYDCTPSLIVEISGADATAFVQRAFSGNTDVPVGTAVDTLMLDEAGGIVGTATAARTGRNTYFVRTSGGATGTRQLARLRRRQSADDSVTIIDRDSGLCGIGVCGPSGRELLDSVLHGDVSEKDSPFRTVQETYADSVPVTVLEGSRIGEPRWELFAPMEYGSKLWDLLRERAQEHDIVAVGDGALHSLELETGGRNYGRDIRSEYTPVAVGLEDALDFGAEFIGHESLVECDDQQPDTELTCLTLADPETVVLGGKPIVDDGTTIGYVADSGYGYSVGRCILRGYLPPAYTDPGTTVTVQYENERYTATVREEPLIE